MPTEFHQRVRDLLASACDERTDRRTAFLREVAGGDTGALREALRLLPAFAAVQQRPESAGEILPRATDLALALSKSVEPPAWQPPFSIAPYTVAEVLGEGGMGVVYRAVHPVQNTSVAIKLLKAPLQSREARRQFKHEEELLRRLHHPGIVRLLHGGVTDRTCRDRAGRSLAERPYLVMEYVPGERLLACVERLGLNPLERLALLATICRAVEYAHRREVIHCDLKPGNILVKPSGETIVLDFGISRIQALDVINPSGAFVGTLAYASPEQFDGSRRRLTPASDVFTLGLIGHELLTGRLPERGSPGTVRLDLRDVCLSQHRGWRRADDDALRTSVHEVLATAVRNARRKRFGHAGALADALDTLLARYPVRRGFRGLLQRVAGLLRGRDAGDADNRQRLLATVVRKRIANAMDRETFQSHR